MKKNMVADPGGQKFWDLISHQLIKWEENHYESHETQDPKRISSGISCLMSNENGEQNHVSLVGKIIIAVTSCGIGINFMITFDHKSIFRFIS